MILQQVSSFLLRFKTNTMLLQLENTSRENLNRLLGFAREHDLKLELVDDLGVNYYLPGKPLSDEELLNLVKSCFLIFVIIQVWKFKFKIDRGERKKLMAT